MKRAKQQDIAPEPTQRKYPWLKKDVHSWDKKEMAFARRDVSEMFDSPIFELAFYGFVSRVEELAVEAAAGGALMITEMKPFDARRLAQAVGMAATPDEVVKFLGICEAWDILSKSGDTYTLNYYGKIVGKVDTTAADRQRRFRERERERLKALASEGEARVTIHEGVTSVEVVMCTAEDDYAAEPMPEAREQLPRQGNKVAKAKPKSAWGRLQQEVFTPLWDAYPVEQRNEADFEVAFSKFKAVFPSLEEAYGDDLGGIRDGILASLENWKKSEKWRSGYVKGFNNFITEKFWSKHPAETIRKPAAARSTDEGINWATT